MGRLPTYDASLTRGSWAKDEDVILKSYIEINGVGNWKHLPKLAGLKRCGKSCRLRWINYLRSDIKRGNFSEAEEKLIVDLHSFLGNKWSRIAAQMEDRTDNEIKNYWNTTIKKKLLMKGIDPVTHQQRADFNILENLPNLIAAASNLNNFAPNPLTNNAFHQIPPDMQLLQSLIRAITNSSLIPNTEAMSQLQSLIALHNLKPFGLSVPSTNLVDLLGSLMNCGISTLNEFGMNNRGVGVSTSTINDTTTSYFSSPTTINMPSYQTITNSRPSMQMTSSIAHDNLIQSPFGFPVSSTNLVGLPGSLMNHGGCSSNEFGMNNSGVGASTSTITDTTTTTSCFSFPATITMPSLQMTPNIMPSQMTSHENILGNQASDVVNIGDFTSSTSNGQTLDDIDLNFNWEDILKACNHGEIQLDGSY